MVSQSFSFSEVLSKLGYGTRSGRNVNTLKARLEYYNISVSHFTHRSSKRIWSDEEIFCKDSMVSQAKLRRTYKSKNIVPYECSICGIPPFWNGSPLVLTLDHINGKNKDNEYENLRWVCPNCDRQLETYGMKNKKHLQKNIVLFSGDYSRPNNIDKVVVKIPDREELKDKLWEFKNYTQVANYYNVSPTQIRRWCRKYELPATINIIKHTSQTGWDEEKWNDFYKPNNSFIEIIEKSIPCIMLDIESEEVIKEFSSRAEAIKYLGISSKNASSHIGAVCKDIRKTAYGYKWKNRE